MEKDTFPIIDKATVATRKALLVLLSGFKEGESYVFIDLSRKELLRLKGCMQAINLVKGSRSLVLNTIFFGKVTKHIVSKLWI